MKRYNNSKYSGGMMQQGGTSVMNKSQQALANAQSWMPIANQINKLNEQYQIAYNSVFNTGKQEGWDDNKLKAEIAKATTPIQQQMAALQSQMPKKYADGGITDIGPGSEGGGKPKGKVPPTGVLPPNPNVFNSQAEIDAANNFAQNFAANHPNYATAVGVSSTYAGRNIGDLKPQFVYEGGVPPVNRPKPVTVPDYINQSDIQQANGSYWYEDKDGHAVDVDPSVVNLPRFRAEQQRAAAAKAAGIPESEQPKFQDGGAMYTAAMLGMGMHPKAHTNTDMNIYRDMRAGMVGLDALGGANERSQQNQYMYNQMSSMGQMNAMNNQDFQPNPYNLYARYGGNLKHYRSGGLIHNPKGRNQKK